MKKILLALLLCLFFINTSHTKELVELETYLPRSMTIKADVMAIGAPPQVQVLLDRLQKSLEQHKEWLQEYIKTAAPGTSLKYHENFGLTEEEYQTVLTQSDKLVLVKQQEIELKFSKFKESIQVSSSSTDFPMNNIIYDRKSNVIQTPYGVLRSVSKIEQNDKNSITGRWSGIQWQLQKGNPDEDFSFIKFAIGKLKDQAKGIIYYDVKYRNKDVSEVFSKILLYDF